jgi:hypothetical protein
MSNTNSYERHGINRLCVLVLCVRRPSVPAQMEDQMKIWMKNDCKRLRLTTSSGILGNGQTLTLSRIFLWFRDDFGGSKDV